MGKLHQCAAVRKTHTVLSCHGRNPVKSDPVKTGTALTRLLTAATLSVGQVFLCTFSTARPVTDTQFSFWTLPVDRRLMLCSQRWRRLFQGGLRQAVSGVCGVELRR